MISVRIRKSAVASAFIRLAYRVRRSCAYGVRQTIADRRPKSLRVLASYLLLQASSPYFLMSDALLRYRIG
jgi:hypothetical protein